MNEYEYEGFFNFVAGVISSVEQGNASEPVAFRVIRDEHRRLSEDQTVAELASALAEKPLDV